MYLKALGVELTFEDEGTTLNIESYDESRMDEYHYGDMTFVGTKWDFEKEVARLKAEQAVLEVANIIDEDKLKEAADKVLEKCIGFNFSD